MEHSKPTALVVRLALSAEFLGQITERMLERPDLPEIIPSHLVLLHQISRASIPLMATAQAEAGYRANDSLCAKLETYFERHIEEEKHHDQWVLDDLASIGIKPADVLRRLPSANVASLVGAQYYWVKHHHPVALLGYIALLEGNPPTLSLVNELQAKTRLPGTAFRTIRLHATDDPHHKSALYTLLGQLGLGDELETLVSISATHTSTHYAHCLAELQPWACSQS